MIGGGGMVSGGGVFVNNKNRCFKGKKFSPLCHVSECDGRFGSKFSLLVVLDPV